MASFAYVLKNNTPLRNGTGLTQVRNEVEILRNMEKREGVQNELHVAQKVSKTVHWRMEEENTKMCIF